MLCLKSFEVLTAGIWLWEPFILQTEGPVPQNIYIKLFQRVLHTSHGIQMDDGKLMELKPSW